MEKQEQQTLEEVVVELHQLTVLLQVAEEPVDLVS
jgi:hypothetical protein